MKKRGQQLETNTIIVVILAVLVLVVLALFFTGGFTTFYTKISNIWRVSGQEASEIVLTCNGLCTSYETSGIDKYKSDYCQKEFDIDTNGDKKKDGTVTCPDLSTSCPAIQNAGGCF